MTAEGNEPDSGRSACARKALDLLARRPHFRRELEDKLKRRAFDEGSIGRVCDELESSGYLDDLDCARGLTRGSLRRKGFGPRRVRAELARRGAREDIVDQAVAEAFEDGEGPRVRETAKAWLRRQSWNREKLARHLERKGFTSGAILSVLRDLESEVRSPGPDSTDQPADGCVGSKRGSQ